MEEIKSRSLPVEVIEFIFGTVLKQEPYVKLEEVCRKWQALVERSNQLAIIKLRWKREDPMGTKEISYGGKMNPSKVVSLLFEDQMDECGKLTPLCKKKHSKKLKIRTLSLFLLREEWIQRENLIDLGRSLPSIKIDLQKKGLKEVKEIFQAHQKKLSMVKELALLPESLTRIPLEIGYCTGLETLFFLPMSHIRFLPMHIQKLTEFAVAHSL